MGVVVAVGKHVGWVTVNVDFARGVVRCFPCGVAMDASCESSESFS